MRILSLALIVLILSGFSNSATPKENETQIYGLFILAESEPERAYLGMEALIKEMEADKTTDASLLSTAYTYFGTISAMNRLPDKCLETLNKAIELNPANVEAYIRRGIAHAKMKKPDLSEADFKKAISLDAGNDKLKKRIENLRDQLNKSREADSALSDPK